MSTEPKNIVEDSEAERMTIYWASLAAMLGYNELAKKADTLGSKCYFRFIRDAAQEKFIELGGNSDVFTKEDYIMKIEVNQGMPYVVFREQDIELMRDTIYFHDIKKREEDYPGADHE